MARDRKISNYKCQALKQWTQQNNKPDTIYTKHGQEEIYEKPSNTSLILCEVMRLKLKLHKIQHLLACSTNDIALKGRL